MLSPRQILTVERLFRGLNFAEFHHGDCIGADSQAHDIVARIKPSSEIVIHPPVDPSKRAFRESSRVRTERPYLERNHIIVDETELLIAAPSSIGEELRSGTWSTIRYARKVGQPVIILDR